MKTSFNFALSKEVRLFSHRCRLRQSRSSPVSVAGTTIFALALIFALAPAFMPALIFPLFFFFLHSLSLQGFLTPLAVLKPLH